MIDRRAVRSKEPPVPLSPPVSDPSDAAEAIRAHLVCVRGGAPFLSPADTRILAQWLDQGHSVGAMIAAIDRVAENRRKRPTRLPFTLARAKRYLDAGSPVPSLPADDTKITVLTGFLHELRGWADRSPQPQAVLDLAGALQEISELHAPEMERRALILFASFHDRTWRGLPAAERRARLTRAREELGDLLELMDPDARDGAIEELARADLRRCYPLLTAQALRGALAR